MTKRPGDWDCPKCGDMQFARNVSCKQCGQSNPKQARTSSGIGSNDNMKQGDWNCPSCGDHQFAKNAKCRQCGTAKPSVSPSSGSSSSSSPSSGMKPGDWVCPGCSDHQFAKNVKCRQCGHDKPSATTPTHTTAPQVKIVATPVGVKYYLGIDIEARGDSLFNPVTAIGVYLGPVDPNTPNALTIKKRWALEPLPGQTDQELCVKEFWAKFPEVDQWIKDNARPANIVMNEFLEFCRDVVAKVGPGNIKIVTDCPDLYDIYS